MFGTKIKLFLSAVVIVCSVLAHGNAIPQQKLAHGNTNPPPCLPDAQGNYNCAYNDPGNPTRSIPQIKNFIGWSHIGFQTSSPNSHSQDYTTTPDLPAGWVVCRHFVGSSSVGRGAGWSYGFLNPLPNDPQSPARKKAIVYHLTAPAGPLWDQWGSNVDLFNVGIEAISDDATVQQRWDNGCEMDH